MCARVRHDDPRASHHAAVEMTWRGVPCTAALRQLLERRGDKIIFSSWIQKNNRGKPKRRLFAVGQYHVLTVKRKASKFVVRRRLPREPGGGWSALVSLT